MRLTWCILAAALLGACDQPAERRAEYVSSTGVIMRPYAPIPTGTAPRGTAALRAALAGPPEQAGGDALLRRGREGYVTFCVPCHGRRGYGDGPVVQRGHPAPPSYHIERLRAAEPAEIVRVITEGRGQMWPYAERIPPADRWAIAAFVKALQRTEASPPAADVDPPPASPPGAPR